MGVLSSLGQLGFGEEPIKKNSGDFFKVFSKLQNPKTAVPEGALHRDLNLKYVFVTGLGGDYVPGYYAFQIDQLKKLGVPARNLHVIRPASRRAAETNWPTLMAEINKIQGRVVVVAHSKGANESFAMAVQRPELFDDKIQAMYLMQAGYFGSPVADELVSERTHDISHLSPYERRWLSFERVRGRFMYGVLFRHGLRSVTTRKAGDFMHRILTANPKSAGILRRKVFFITSETETGVVTRMLQGYGPNDSILPLSSQWVPGWGEHLVHVDGNHIDFILPFGNAVQKSALARAIFTHVEAQGEMAKHCPYLLAGD